MTKIERLIGLLHNPDYHLRVRAVNALGKHTSERAIELLIEHLGELDRADEESKVNWAASAALHNIGEPALDRLIEALHEKRDQPNDNWRRYWVAVTLGYMGDVRSVEILIEALEDEGVRGGVAEALGQIGDKRALEPLIRILPQSRGYAPIAIRNAIETLQGK